MALKVYLLGQFSLREGELPIELPSRPAQSLFAYLALHAGVAHRRERLAGLIWPESTESNARGYLRQALWRIRKGFESASVPWEQYLQINDLTIMVNDQPDLWLDVKQLLEPREAGDTEKLISRVALYKGELLPGFYDEWVFAERDRLQSLYHQKMNALMAEFTAAQRWDDLLTWAEEWIRLGVSPEPAFRALMEGYAGLGDQGMVSATYQRCMEALDREVGLDPSAETRRLYEQILIGEWAAESKPKIHPPQPVELPPYLLEGLGTDFERPLFVARLAELEKLGSHLELVLAGKGRVVFVTGEAGSGKTALIQEFTNQAQDSHGSLVAAAGNCNAHTGLGDPYLPFREILEMLSGDVEARWAAGTISEEYAERLWMVFPETLEAVLESSPGLIDTFISGSSLRERAQTLDAGEEGKLQSIDRLLRRRSETSQGFATQQSDLFEQYTRVVCTLANSRPLVLVLDDFQWADLGSISLLFHLGRRIKNSRVLILCAYRPEEVAFGREGQRHPLEPVVNEFLRQYGESTVNVDRADGRVFIDALLDSETNRLGEAFRIMFFRQTHGNPLFSLELLRGMQERGDLIRDDLGQWVEGPELDWETLPARVEAVIAERIGRLAQTLQAILRTASVEGDTFTAEVVAGVLATGARRMSDQLSRELDKKHRLIRSQSIIRVNGQLLSYYRFRHTLFQKYLYSSLDEVERVYLHEQVGRVIEELYRTEDESSLSMDLAPKLAWHYREARIAERAVFYLLRAGKRALQMPAYKEAIDHLSSGLDLLKQLQESEKRDRDELSLLHNVAMAWQGLEGAHHAEVKRAYTRAQELCRKMGSATELCHVLGEMVEFAYVGADYVTAVALAEEALSTADAVNQPILQVCGNWYVGYTRFATGDFTGANEKLERAIDLYNPEKHHGDLVRLRGKDAGLGAMGYSACCLWALGYQDQALALSQKSLALARNLAHLFTLADALAFAGNLLNEMRLDGMALESLAEEMIEVTEAAVPGWRGTGQTYLGEALIINGRLQEGIMQLEEGLERRMSTESLCYTTAPMGMLAVAQSQLGDPEQGMKTLTEALKLVEHTGERYAEAELYRYQGDIYQMLGDATKAEGSYFNALEIARRQQARSWELRAATSLAELYRDQDRKEEAVQVLRPVYDWFSEGFDTPDLVRAASLLKELS